MPSPKDRRKNNDSGETFASFPESALKLKLSGPAGERKLPHRRSSTRHTIAHFDQQEDAGESKHASQTQMRQNAASEEETNGTSTISGRPRRRSSLGAPEMAQSVRDERSRPVTSSQTGRSRRRRPSLMTASIVPENKDEKKNPHPPLFTGINVRDRHSRKNYRKEKSNLYGNALREYAERNTASYSTLQVEDEDESPNVQENKQLFEGKISQALLALDSSNDPLSFHIREDVRSITIEQPIPYFLSIPRSFRKAYKLVLKLAARIARKHSAPNWTGITFLFGNAVQCGKWLRLRVNSRPRVTFKSPTRPTTLLPPRSKIMNSGNQKKTVSFKNVDDSKETPDSLNSSMTSTRLNSTFDSSTDVKNGGHHREHASHRDLVQNFNTCEAMVVDRMTKGSVFVVTSKGIVEACARDASAPHNLLSMQLDETNGYTLHGDSVKWPALSRLPCVVIRATPDSKGRLDVYYNGAHQRFSADKKDECPQGESWYDSKLYHTEEALPPAVPMSANLGHTQTLTNGWHPHLLEIEIVEQKCKENDELQQSIFTISGPDPTFAMDELTLRYAARAIKKNTYNAALWFPGNSIEGAKYRLLELGNQLRLWKDLTTLPSHQQRVRLFYEELLSFYPKVLIIMTSMFQPEGSGASLPIEAIAPPAAVPPECYVHMIVSTLGPLPEKSLPHIKRVGNVKLTGYRTSQALKILSLLPHTPSVQNSNNVTTITIPLNSTHTGTLTSSSLSDTKYSLTEAQRSVVEQLHVELEGNPMAIRIACSFIVTSAQRNSMSIKEYLSNLLDSRHHLETARKDPRPISPVFCVVADAIRALRSHRTPILILSIIAYLNGCLGVNVGFLVALTNAVERQLRNRFLRGLKFLLSVGLITRSPDLDTVHMHPSAQFVIQTMLKADRQSSYHRGRSDGAPVAGGGAESVRGSDVLACLLKAMKRIFKFVPGTMTVDRRDRVSYLHVISVASHACRASSKLSAKERESALLLLCRASEFVGTMLRQREEARQLAAEAVRMADHQISLYMDLPADQGPDESNESNEGKHDRSRSRPITNRIGALIRYHCELTLARAEMRLDNLSAAEKLLSSIINGLRVSRTSAAKKRSESRHKSLGRINENGDEEEVVNASTSDFRGDDYPLLEHEFTNDPQQKRPGHSKSNSMQTDGDAKRRRRNASEPTEGTGAHKQSSREVSQPESLGIRPVREFENADGEDGNFKSASGKGHKRLLSSSGHMATSWSLPPFAEGLWVMAHVSMAKIQLEREQATQAEQYLKVALDAVERGWASSKPDKRKGWWRGSGRTLVLSDLMDNIAVLKRRMGDTRESKKALVDSIYTRYACGGGTGPLNMRNLTRGDKSSLPGIPWVRDGLGRTCNSLGVTLTKMGKNNLAGRAFEAAYGIMSLLHGTGSPEAATVLLNWAVVLEKKGAIRGSFEGILTALMARRRLYGDRSILVAEARNNLAITLWKIGGGDISLRHAERELLQAVVVKTQASDAIADVPESKRASIKIAHSRVNMGNVLSSRENYEGSIIEYNKALFHYKYLLGDQSSEVADVENNLGVSEFNLKNYRTAQKHHNQALRIRKSIATEKKTMAKTARSSVKSSEDSLKINQSMMRPTCEIM